MSPASEKETVLDTTVLSNYAHVDAVDLLVELPRIVTVDIVQTELEAGIDTHPYLKYAIVALEEEIPVLSLSDEAQVVQQELLGVLDPGEAHVLALAEAVDGIDVTDDGDARKIARERDIDLTGSIGLLVRFVERDRLSPETADTYLKRWIDEAGFHSPSREFEAFLSDNQEDQ